MAELFVEDVQFEVPGDRRVAWWVGRYEGRAGVARFFEEMREALEPVTFAVEIMLIEDKHAVVIGTFEKRVRRTGRSFSSPFVIHAVVRDGLIARYLFLEDSAAARQAASTNESRSGSSIG